LPRECRNPLLLHPHGRSGFNLRNDLSRRSCRRQSHCKMNVVGNSAHSKALAIQLARGSGEISMEVRDDVFVDEWSPVFRAEDDMHQIETQRLRHGGDYMSGLQPSAVLADTYLGLRPRLVCRRTFGPQSMPTQTSDASGNVFPNQPRVSMSLTENTRIRFARRPPTNRSPILRAPKARQHTSLGRRPR
jgi:hypothetical protein